MTLSCVSQAVRFSPVADVTISLSSHPPFMIPRQGPGVDLKEEFPPPLHAQLEAVTRLFSQDAGMSHFYTRIQALSACCPSWHGC